MPQTPELPPHVSASYGIQPFERQSRESETEWAQFRLYRDSGYPKGPGETFVARDLKQLSLATGVRLGELKAAYATYAWEERCGAYDREIERRKFEACMTGVQRVEYAYQRMREKSRLILETALDEIRARQEAGEHLSTRDALSLKADCEKSDRLWTGQSTENVSVKHGFDLEKATPEELEVLAAFQADLTARKG